jgi:hypothetical protein
VHDIADLETRGVPGVFIASDEFISAATAQSVALGFPTIQRVFTSHPIQDRNDDEMRQLAEDVFEQVIACITN